MEQDIAELRDLTDVNRLAAITKRPRPLTHDERKAAEAAFQHAPFNPDWSEAARKVYDGINGAMDRLKPSGLLLQPAEAYEEMWQGVV
jgi:hypothetical protein